MKLQHLGSNQTQITIGMIDVLISYSTPVACRIGTTYYVTDTKYSPTTSKHINRWLAGCKAETKPQSFFNSLVI